MKITGEFILNVQPYFSNTTKLHAQYNLKDIFASLLMIFFLKNPYVKFKLGFRSGYVWMCEVT